MENPIESLAQRFQQVFDGDPWYGRSVMETLLSISEAKAQTAWQDKSILQLVLHMIAWRHFTLQKLQGNIDFDLDDETDWPSGKGVSWKDALKALQSNQQQLLLALEKTPNSKLAEKVPGRKYSFAVLLDGLLQHDIYHLGQISLLNKL